jgi:hypothetical protein
MSNSKKNKSNFRIRTPKKNKPKSIKTKKNEAKFKFFPKEIYYQPNNTSFF